MISLLIFFEFKNLKSRLYFATRDKALKRFINNFDYHFSLSEDLSKCFKKNFSNIEIYTLYPPIDKNYVRKIESANNDMILSFFQEILQILEKYFKKNTFSKYKFIFREKEKIYSKKILI